MEIDSASKMSSTKKKAPVKFPDRLLQEMRSLVAVECRELTYGKRGEGMTGLQQEQYIEKAFHGTDMYASHLNKLIEGKHPYFQLYEFMPLENCREGNEERAKWGGQMLELTEMFHCSSGGSCFSFLVLGIYLKCLTFLSILQERNLSFGRTDSHAKPLRVPLTKGRPLDLPEGI